MNFDSYKEEIKFLRGQGRAFREIVDIIHQKYFKDTDPRLVQYRVSNVLYRRKKEAKVPEKRIMLQNFSPVVSSSDWDGVESIRFGVVSDTHFNNVCTQITHLNTFYDIAQAAGVKDIYHCGDIDDGHQMRVGHIYECYKTGGDAHIEHICNAYPQRDGITTHFITGNHDASIWKQCGINIGPQIAERREDLHYLGPDVAIVNLTDKCTLELRHPWDGTSYALSYKPQKLIESLSDEEKPSILCIGHYHKQGSFLYRGVYTLLTGCFCSQTPFMKGKGLAATVGGWLVEVLVDREGNLRSITPQFIPFSKSITDDYKSYI